ncbi:MAG: hypothetical protein CVU48_07360 [Candidatus Cloacimonetes bacterium HGW-Cloacimonetes-1]|nr:MAG: hypothetical protein CVU48_07360 [Candidatus Cloacimonetes bacterium HGW-Cloacimonetes-1]
MLTIDWKERLNKDTIDFFESKLPKNDYDFEIIFNAYSARVNGKIPSEVIVYVANVIIHQIGRNHEKYVAFYQYLWNKKGDYGKLAFLTIMSKIVAKKPAVYFPMVETAMQNADTHDLNGILEKVMMPLLKKHPETYLPYVYKWMDKGSELIIKSCMGTLIKLIKRNPELIPMVMEHFKHDWNYPITAGNANHILMLKTVGKIDFEQYLSIYLDYQNSRDPQIVEILCGGIYDYHPELEKMVERWTHSGNARLKKAAVSAYKVLTKKK